MSANQNHQPSRAGRHTGLHFFQPFIPRFQQIRSSSSFAGNGGYNTIHITEILLGGLGVAESIM